MARRLNRWTPREERLLLDEVRTLAEDSDKYPIEYKIIDERTITVRWTAGYSGQFEIQYGDLTKTIVVESLF